MIKVKQIEPVSNFFDKDIETPLNDFLIETQKYATITKITYITNTRTGDISCAIVEYTEND